MRADTVDMAQTGMIDRHSRGGRARQLSIAVLAFVLTLVLCAPAYAQQTAVPLGSLLSQAGAQAPTIGEVDRISLGSQGATITLEGGEEVALDFSGLSGVGGGPNYVGWAMVLLGLSVFTRLLSSLSRILRPFRSRRPRRYYDE